METPVRLGLLALALSVPSAFGAPAIGPNSFVTGHDTIPNFARNHTIQSVQNGSWFQASTWNPARVPLPTDIVAVGNSITYNGTTGDVDVIGIDAGGALRFAPGQNTLLKVGVLLVMPQGTLEVGTAANPVGAAFKAEIVIKNRPLNASTDPDQYGTGLLSVDGKVTLHGAVKSPTFVRVAVEPLAGHNTVTLEQAVSGWRQGDRIFLPDTRHVTVDNWFNPDYALQVEERTIQSISADGKTLTLQSALTHNHRGARDADGTPTVLAGGIKLLPHVGNLTRNVVIRSENPAGTRGHTLYTQRSDIDLRYAQYQDLGRTRAETLDPVTNHVGRYPVHIHHVWGPPNPTNTGYQFEVVGNAINDSLKWPMTLHGSHYGLLRQNVVFGGSQLTGAGIALEDGSETENLIEENFIANVRGNINARNTGSDTTTPGSGGEGFWAAGFNNRFVNNVASDCRNPAQQIVAGPGFKFFTPAAPFTTVNPRFRGADLHDADETVTVTPQRQPLLEFRGNEVYGGSAAGMTIWNLGTDGAEAVTVAESVIKDFRVWHVYEAAIWNYPVQHLTIDGLVYRVDPSAATWEPAVQSGDYRNIDMTIRGGDIHAGGVFGGTEAPLGTIRIENVQAVTRGHAFSFATPETPGTQAGIPDPPGITVILRNNVISAWPGQPLRTISMDFQTGSATYPHVRYQVFAYDYQGLAGSNYQIFWREQATQNIAGGFATCNDTTSHPEIDGIPCPIGPPPTDSTPPSVPGGLSAVPASSTQINLSWNIATDNVGVAGYRVFRGGAQIATTTATSYQNTGLSPSTTYTYRVAAVDAAGNVSAQSSPDSATTLAPPPSSDTTPPSVPTGLEAMTLSPSEIHLTWNASTDNVGVTGYHVYQGGVHVATTTETMYHDAGLAASTDYTYTVVARDAAGNASGHSSSASATTSSAPAGGGGGGRRRGGGCGATGMEAGLVMALFLALRSKKEKL